MSCRVQCFVLTRLDSTLEFPHSSPPTPVGFRQTTVLCLLLIVPARTPTPPHPTPPHPTPLRHLFFYGQTLCAKIIIQLKTLSAQSKMHVSGRLQVI